MTTTIGLQHREFPFLQNVTRFTYNNVAYHWRGLRELVEDEYPRSILAGFQPLWFLHPGTKIGQFVISSNAKDMMDLIVVTGFVVQERDDEHRLVVDLKT
jgi:hypothetical protein